MVECSKCGNIYTKLLYTENNPETNVKTTVYSCYKCWYKTKVKEVICSRCKNTKQDYSDKHKKCEKCGHLIEKFVGIKPCNVCIADKRRCKDCNIKQTKQEVYI